jgi:hypothetical protein
MASRPTILFNRIQSCVEIIVQRGTHPPAWKRRGTVDPWGVGELASRLAGEETPPWLPQPGENPQMACGDSVFRAGGPRGDLPRAELREGGTVGRSLPLLSLAASRATSENGRQPKPDPQHMAALARDQAASPSVALTLPLLPTVYGPAGTHQIRPLPQRTECRRSGLMNLTLSSAGFHTNDGT